MLIARGDFKRVSIFTQIRGIVLQGYILLHTLKGANKREVEAHKRRACGIFYIRNIYLLWCRLFKQKV